MVRGSNQGTGATLLGGKERTTSQRALRERRRGVIDCSRTDARTRAAVQAALAERVIKRHAARRARAAKLAPRTYFAPGVAPYLRRNLSTRPAVSTIFCLPV